MRDAQLYANRQTKQAVSDARCRNALSIPSRDVRSLGKVARAWRTIERAYRRGSDRLYERGLRQLRAVPSNGRGARTYLRLIRRHCAPPG